MNRVIIAPSYSHDASAERVDAFPSWQSGSNNPRPLRACDSYSGSLVNGQLVSVSRPVTNQSPVRDMVAIIMLFAIGARVGIPHV
jgi:hypothetical protein